MCPSPVIREGNHAHTGLRVLPEILSERHQRRLPVTSPAKLHRTGKRMCCVLLGVFWWELLTEKSQDQITFYCLCPLGQTFFLGPWQFSLCNKDWKSFQAILSVPHLIQMALHTPILVPILFSPLRVKKNSL